jgi:hypothetical protein
VKLASTFQTKASGATDATLARGRNLGIRLPPRNSYNASRLSYRSLAACKTMQHWGSLRCSVSKKIGARPQQPRGLSRTTIPVLAIMLAISGNAVQARSELEVQQRSLAEQKSRAPIPWPRSRPKEAPAQPQGSGNTPRNEERAVEQRSQESAAAPPPSDCQLRLTPDLAAIQALPPISSGQCVAEDVVRVDSVVAHEGWRIAITPPATLRCPMAESVIHWVRDELTSIAAEFGAPLKSLLIDTSYECRSRNHVAGAKLSEHGRANAIDVRGFALVDGTVVELTDPAMKKETLYILRETACARFTTVLGPGSDTYHENHVHLDIIDRRRGYRICQWNARDQNLIGAVPLPPDRPPSAPARSTTGKSAAD